MRERMPYEEIVERRKALRVPRRYAHRYVTLADARLDGPWVTPLQKTSCDPSRLVLVAQDYLDTDRAERNRADILEGDGYCPGTRFRHVLSEALAMACLRLEQVYVTQTLHYLPRTWFHTPTGELKKWKGGHPDRLVRDSFKCVTRHELAGRTFIAMGSIAAKACREGGLRPDGQTDHPSRPGNPEQRIHEIGTEVRRVLGMPPLDIKRRQ